MTLSRRARIWIAAIAIPLGVLLLWLGYAEDQRRDHYYDCRQSAMDGLHTALGAHLDAGNGDPDVWVPRWQQDFRDWHTMLAMCMP